MAIIWQEEFNSINELTQKLYKHRYWSKIAKDTINNIFKQLYKNTKNIVFFSAEEEQAYLESTGKEKMERHELYAIREFLMVSEEYGMVKNNFIKIAKTYKNTFGKEFSNIYFEFAVAFERVGAAIYLYCSDNNISDEEYSYRMPMAEAAYRCSILCNEYFFPSYASLIMLLSVFLDLKRAIEWKELFELAVIRLNSIDNSNLDTSQISLKKDKASIQELREAINEIIRELPAMKAKKEEELGRPLKPGEWTR